MKNAVIAHKNECMWSCTYGSTWHNYTKSFNLMWLTNVIVNVIICNMDINYLKT